MTIRNAIVGTFIIAMVALAFGLGRWTAPQQGLVAVAAAPTSEPAAKHVELGIGSCSATGEPAATLTTLADQRVALEP